MEEIIQKAFEYAMTKRKNLPVADMEENIKVLEEKFEKRRSRCCF